MPRSLDLYLLDLLNATDRIQEFTFGMEFAEYESRSIVRSAVERQFTIIGEAMRQMQQHYPAYLHGILESRKIVDFRNFLVHQYSSVDDEEVWSAVKSKLPGFRDQVQTLIHERQTPTSS